MVLILAIFGSQKIIWTLYFLVTIYYLPRRSYYRGSHKRLKHIITQPSRATISRGWSPTTISRRWSPTTISRGRSPTPQCRSHSRRRQLPVNRNVNTRGGCVNCVCGIAFYLPRKIRSSAPFHGLNIGIFLLLPL